MRVMIVVTHLLGTGHLSRAMVLGRALRSAGHTVHVVSGGMPVAHFDTAGLDVTQLPPLRSDGVNFTRLLDDTGAEASAELFAQRRTALLAALKAMRPDVLMTELFPFGRRVLSAEFHALLDAARALRPRPLICASVRDILAPPSKPEKIKATDAVISEFYDAVFVHSDPTVIPLEASWPVSAALARKLVYTGFVAQDPSGPHPRALGKDQIVVSTGGGDVGEPVYSAAIEAAQLDSGLRWHLLIGGRNAMEKCAEFKVRAPQNATIEPARTDFRQILYHAKASVSMCGYNTALDVLQAGTPALFIPFDAGGEVEQTLRANALEKLDAIRILTSDELSGTRMLAMVRELIAAPVRGAASLSMDGAAETVRLLANLVGKTEHAM